MFEGLRFMNNFKLLASVLTVLVVLQLIVMVPHLTFSRVSVNNHNTRLIKREEETIIRDRHNMRFESTIGEPPSTCTRHANRTLHLTSSYTQTPTLSATLSPISSTLPLCDVDISNLGPQKIDRLFEDFKFLHSEHSEDLLPGGLFQPKECISTQRVAIIVPYRDREYNLKILLHNLHPMLKKQKLEYMIFVIEQAPGSSFNRGMIKNIGFVEARQLCNFDCYIFQDVDLIPEDERNLYKCSEKPKHHSSALDTFNYRLPYGSNFGGVVSFRKEAYEKINGYSNMYFDWGAEDDDLWIRVHINGMKVERYSRAISHYKDLKHSRDKKNMERLKLLESCTKRIKYDGINSLVYKRHLIEFRDLYTWIYVGINRTEYIKTHNITK